VQGDPTGVFPRQACIDLARDTFWWLPLEIKWGKMVQAERRNLGN
jgi:hypothetical protein